MTHHTPGPWFATIQENDTIYIHDAITDRAASFGTIAEIGRDTNYPAIAKIDEANANLIAAAPEMLEALKAITRVNWVDMNYQAWEYEFLPQLLNAIAKAEGRA
jgi:hypothetical protein